jgi:hypothetical protein
VLRLLLSTPLAVREAPSKKISHRNAQATDITCRFYMTCYQVTVTGGGSATPATVKLPGAYKASDPGILVNIHMNLKTYTSKFLTIWCFVEA